MSEQTAVQAVQGGILAPMSAHDVAQSFIHGGERSERIQAAIRAQYEPEFIQSCADVLIKLSGATTSGNDRIKHFGQTVQRAVPKDQNGEPIVPVLTVKFKALKSPISKLDGGKTLHARVETAKKPAKPGSAQQAAKALIDAAAHLCDAQLLIAATGLIPAMNDCRVALDAKNDAKLIARLCGTVEALEEAGGQDSE